MNKALLIIAMMFCAVNARALTNEEVETIVAAIYRIEGGEKAKKPYGILSIPVRDKAHAKRICENTVRNNWRRWTESGKKERFFDFLADRYVPIAHDRVGNQNWKRNIRLVTKLPY